MPRPHPIPNDPDPDRDGCWSSRDQEQPGVSIRPLSQTDLQALVTHLTYDHHQDEQSSRDLGEGFRPVRFPAADGPVVAVRVRASVGRPGASAEAEHRRRRTAELTAWTRGLPWRASAVLTAGLAGGLLGARVAPRLAGLLALAAAAAVGWQLRFRPSVDTRAWRRGAKGERRTARLLAPSSGRAGRSCMIWLSPARPRTSIIS